MKTPKIVLYYLLVILITGLSSSVVLAGDTNVFRLYSAERNEHFYTISDAERISQTCTNPQVKYAVTRMPSTIFRAYNTQSSTDLPVYRLHSPSRSDHLYTLSWLERDYAQTIGYIYEGIPFYAHNSPQAGDSPVFRRYFPAGGGHTYNLIDYPTGYHNGDYYVSEGIVFWTSESAPKQIYSLFNNINRTQLLATYQEVEAINCFSANYKNEGIAFSVYDSSGTGRTPVERFVYLYNFPHAYTTSSIEEQIFTSYNMKDEGVAYYVDSTATLPVYRLRKEVTGYPIPRYFFTTNMAEKENAEQQGYIYEGIPYNADSNCVSSCTNLQPSGN